MLNGGHAQRSWVGWQSGGDSDTRNTYDRVSAKQEADLRPKLERLDRLIARSEGIDPAALTFEFRPLWQLDAATAATVALQKAQATQVYAGLGFWPAEVAARLVEAQLAEDGAYPNSKAVFAKNGAVVTSVRNNDHHPQNTQDDYHPDQPRGPDGRWVDVEGAIFGSATPPLHLQEIASSDPPLRRIHPDSTYATDPEAKRSLEYWQKQSTDDIVKDLRDNPKEPLTRSAMEGS